MKRSVRPGFTKSPGFARRFDTVLDDFEVGKALLGESKSAPGVTSSKAKAALPDYGCTLSNSLPLQHR